MKIALIGASGNIGRRIAGEALDRGHTVLNLGRTESAQRAGAPHRLTDVFDPKKLAQAIKGCDALVSAYRAPDDSLQLLASLTKSMVEAARAARIKRLLVVGGAGSLEVSPGVKLASTPGFPEHLKAKAAAHDEAIAVLKTANDLDWTCLAPAAQIGPGTKTGKYRGAVGSLVKDAEGRSAISYEDFADALITELEARSHVREIYSVAM